ncbi:hypothetical protein [Kitasatospora indigofera]|uniref:hypothetical protein n=1 Tax=Kitasatospora indigofera TaxID=67307 RepID=UPI003675B359
MHAAIVLCGLGHVATTAQLLGAGVPRRALGQLLGSRRAERLRRGLFVCTHLPTLQRLASSLGAQLDCVSVLRENGIWAAEDYRLHLRVPSHGDAPNVQARFSAGVDALVLAQGDARADAPGTLSAQPILRSDPRRGIQTHWGGDDGSWRGGPTAASVSVVAALRQAMSCLDPDDVVAALESALYLQKISRDELSTLVAAAPRRLEAALREIDDGAQSGVETRVRLGFRRLGFRVVPQAYVPGVGHVDNLVEDCVAVESDGRRFHEGSLEDDYDRDMASEYLGVRVLRVSPRIVLHRWPVLAAAVTRMVQQARDRRGR